MKKGKEDKNIIFDKFIKKVSEFSKSDFDKSRNDNYYKNKENSLDYSNINHKHLFEENNIFNNKFPKKNKNAYKVVNYDNNIPLNKKEETDEIEDNLNYSKNFEHKNDITRNNNIYTNPFRNNKGNNHNKNTNDKYKPLYYNDEEDENEFISEFDFETKNDIYNINRKKDNNFSKNLENSKKLKKIDINQNSNKNMNIDDLDLNEEKEEGNGFIYFLIGILGTYSTFIYLCKNKELRTSLLKEIKKFNFQKILDYIKELVNKFKSISFDLEDLKKIFNNGIDCLNKIFNEYNDAINLIGIIIIINLFWLSVKLTYKFARYYLIEKEKEEEKDIECKLTN